MKHKEWAMLLGRFQCLPPHKGHQTLIRKLLKQGKNVCIALRKEDGTDKNPYTLAERTIAFWIMFQKEIGDGTVQIISLPDITEVVRGRNCGWKITEINLDKKTEDISATEIRKQNDK